jgi:DNA-binding CsgD family transcriptional regulator
MITNKKIIKHVKKGLSKRDITILQLLANDKSPLQIALIIGLGNKTVEAAILRLRKLFECRSVTGLVSICYRNKIVK